MVRWTATAVKAMLQESTKMDGIKSNRGNAGGGKLKNVNLCKFTEKYYAVLGLAPWLCCRISNIRTESGPNPNRILNFEPIIGFEIRTFESRSVASNRRFENFGFEPTLINLETNYELTQLEYFPQL